MKLLLIGGSKSGKSLLAQKISKVLGGRLCYLATMQAIDAEDRDRIARHRWERAGWGFVTIEQSRDLESCFSQLTPADTILLDSVTALLAQEMFPGQGMDATAGPRTAEQLLALGERVANVIYVCDQIFGDGVEFEEWTERYRAQLAGVCRILAEHCHGVAEVTAGVPKWHRVPEELTVQDAGGAFW